MRMLCEAADEAWELFEDALLEKLALSMQRRLEAVIRADGWYTKY